MTPVCDYAGPVADILAQHECPGGRVPWQDASYEVIRTAAETYEVSMCDRDGRRHTVGSDNLVRAFELADAAWLRRNKQD